jgi:hypothetical protein
MYLLLRSIQTGSGTHPDFCTISTVVRPLVAKRPKHESDHSLPSSIEVKIEWSYASTPSYALIACARKFYLDVDLQYQGLSQIHVGRRYTIGV